MTQVQQGFVQVSACPLCAGEAQKPVKGTSWKGVAFSYVICETCGLKFMNPRPTQERMHAFFREQYWQENLSATGFPTVPGYDDKEVNQLELRMPKYKRAYQIVSGHLSSIALTSSTRVLEVGCAFGYTLEWLHRDHGAKVFGIEPSSAALERCREAGCIEIVAGSAEEYFVGKKDVPEQQRYDLVLFRHTLETLIDPLPVLRGVREYLARDGTLLVYSPNVEFYDLMSPFTPFVYSPETLTRMLAAAGLEVYRTDVPESPTDRHVALRVKPRYEICAFARRGEVNTNYQPADVKRIQRTIALGNASSTWAQLSTRELLMLLRIKLAKRISSQLGR